MATLALRIDGVARLWHLHRLPAAILVGDHVAWQCLRFAKVGGRLLLPLPIGAVPPTKAVQSREHDCCVVISTMS